MLIGATPDQAARTASTGGERIFLAGYNPSTEGSTIHVYLYVITMDYLYHTSAQESSSFVGEVAASNSFYPGTQACKAEPTGAGGDNAQSRPVGGWDGLARAGSPARPAHFET
jgi:hypothetical protein